MIVFYVEPFQLRKKWPPFKLLYKSNIGPRRNFVGLFNSMRVKLKDFDRCCEVHTRFPLCLCWAICKYLQTLISLKKYLSLPTHILIIVLLKTSEILEKNQERRKMQFLILYHDIGWILWQVEGHIGFKRRNWGRRDWKHSLGRPRITYKNPSQVRRIINLTLTASISEATLLIFQSLKSATAIQVPVKVLWLSEK